MPNNFHVNPETGEAGPCHADVRNCPHGGDSGQENHYDTKDEAQTASENILAERHGLVTTVKKERVSDMRNHPDFGKMDSEIEFACPFSVDKNGDVNGNVENVYSSGAFSLEDGSLETGDDWQAIDGFSGQLGYSGPVMHASEAISGSGLEKYIRENPGTYVVETPFYTAGDDDFEENGEIVEGDGWVLLKKKEEEPKDMSTHPDFGTIDKQTDFDVPFSINDGGTLGLANRNVYAPEVFILDDGSLEIGGDWEAIEGFSGQSSTNGRYTGPCMHSSESMDGSNMERFVRENPGTYVLSAPFRDADEYDDEDEGEIVMDDSWVLLKQK